MMDLLERTRYLRNEKFTRAHESDGEELKGLRISLELLDLSRIFLSITG